MADFHVFDSLFINIELIQNLPYLKKLKVAQKKNLWPKIGPKAMRIFSVHLAISERINFWSVMHLEIEGTYYWIVNTINRNSEN